MTNFDTKLESFIAGCQQITTDHDLEFVPRMAAIRTVKIEPAGGKKFLRINRHEYVNETGEKTNGCVHCFVATQDGHTKALGSFKQGDVFKAAGYKAPAKGARGNIFDENNGLGRMGEYGPAYNR